MNQDKRLFIAAPRGWCAGVERAIEILDVALERLTPPIYVRREIVHNKTVVETYKARGVRFIDEIDTAHDNATVIFSAHGISPEVRRTADKRGLTVIDATCPLVTKVHIEVIRYIERGFTVIYVGHKNHEEAVGVLGEAPASLHIIETEADALAYRPPSDKLAALTQTTLSVDDTKKIIAILKQRFPAMEMPAKEDICYATTNRQEAVKRLIKDHAIELLYVIGSKNSSNSNRLCEVAETMGVPARLIDSAADARGTDWNAKTRVGLTAGASAPESLVRETARMLEADGFLSQEVVFEKENVSFSLPQELKA